MADAVIIDTDPGLDDAVAIMLAVASPELEILGLTTVAGNVPVSVTAANARRVLNLAGAPHIPVFAGADRPLLRPRLHAAHVHGESGLEGYDWPDPDRPPEPEHAVDWIIRTLLARPDGATTLIPVGPLTNIALALRRAPEIAPRIRRIVLMGGGHFAGGNVTPAAEFNIFADPEAASIVFGAGIRLVAVPLDCSMATPTPENWVAALDALGTRCGAACAGMMRHYLEVARRRYGEGGARPLHDPLAVGFVLWPELFAGRLCNVEIETASALTLGATVVDWWQATDRAPNCLWLRECEAAPFFTRLLERLARLP